MSSATFEAMRVPSVTVHPAEVVEVMMAIGSDHALVRDELDLLPGSAGVIDRTWRLYERQWQRFCGATLDPLFARFDHPAAWSGRPLVRDAAPVVVVGTGPSLRRELAALRAHRDCLHIFTSPRGADALAEANITPDLVVIEHQTALDAQFTVQAMADRPQPWRQRVPIIAADGRTPRRLLEEIDRDRVLVIDGSPGWGLWPATAVALAQRAGASAVALLGIDLGTRDCPDWRQQPLLDLLSLLGTDGAVPCLDAGDGALKPGWRQTALGCLAMGARREPLEALRRRWRPLADRLDCAMRAWRRLEPLAADAARALDTASGARDGRHSSAIAVEHAVERLLILGTDAMVRDDIQNHLGCTFLPRYWRTPPDPQLGRQLWRPLGMASHELLAQHRALGAALRAHGAVS